MLKDYLWVLLLQAVVSWGMLGYVGVGYTVGIFSLYGYVGECIRERVVMVRVYV